MFGGGGNAAPGGGDPNNPGGPQQAQAGGQQGGMGDRMRGCADQCKAWLSTLPIMTVTLVSINFFLYLLTLFGLLISSDYAICPNKVSQWDIGGLFTSSWFHQGFYHVFFNMMFLACNGGRLEAVMGSIPFLGLNLMVAFLGNVLYTALSFFLFAISNFDYSSLFQCAVGYSGVLFAILIVDTKTSPTIDRILCCCPVPAVVYPWLMLVGLSVMMDNVSLLGHLCGMLIGYAYCYGLLNWLTLDLNKIHALEQHRFLSWLTTHARFRASPTDAPLIGECQLPFTSTWEGMLCGNFACLGACGAGLTQCCAGISQRLSGVTVPTLPSLGRNNNNNDRYSALDNVGGMEDLDLDGEGFDTDSRFSMGDNDVELGRMDEEDQLSDQQHRRPLPQGRSKLLASVPVMSAREREAAEAAQRSEAKSQLTKAVNHRLGQGPAASTDVPRKPSMADRFGNSAQLAQDDSGDDYTPASWVTDELDEDL